MPASTEQVFIVTGPTSGIGQRAALELANHGKVVLVGRDPAKLAEVQATIVGRGQQAVSVVCDLADPASVRRAAAELVALRLPVAGLLNNAGIMQTRPTKNARGWDLTWATNFLGPFALTEALVPHLPDGAQVLFVASAIEDPERRPAKVLGMRGGRYVSAEASARAEWQPGGASIPGIDAYATSKQALLAATLAFARETPRLRFNAVEPGITPGSGLGRESSPVLGWVFANIVTRLPPFARFRSTPERAGQVIAKILTEPSAATGVYFDERGLPMRGSAQAHDARFQERVVAETRAFLAAAP